MRGKRRTKRKRVRTQAIRLGRKTLAEERLILAAIHGTHGWVSAWAGPLIMAVVREREDSAN